VATLPVLQLIHVSDIHFKHCTANAVHPLAAKRRFSARLLQHVIEKFDIGGWNEGTQGHYPKAPESFRRFLEDWVRGDDRWYGRPDDPGAAQTWLLDSGDLTAFGDAASITLGGDWHKRWRATLNNCPARRIYGNHDAWPGTQPVHGLLGLQDEIDKQQLRLASIPEWDTTSWRIQPLSIPIPGTGGSCIELYALNTVCWGALKNTLAVGDIKESDIDALRGELRKRSSPPHFRILVMHHPLAYPYTVTQRHFPAMILLDADAWARELRNDRNDPQGIGPLIHLFLSGHTHRAYPAGDLPGNVGDIHQGPLSADQLQLVGGPLMLNQSASAAQAQAKGMSLIEHPKRRLYFPTATDARTCQAQILRFFVDTDYPGMLTLFRVPVYSVGGSVYFDTRASEVTVTYHSPSP
jgi:Calcineurin-like phosphoesterase